MVYGDLGGGLGVKLYYTRQGDDVVSIAQVKQVNVDQLIAMNPGITYGALQPGMKVKLPDPMPHLAHEHEQNPMHIHPISYPLPPNDKAQFPGLTGQGLIVEEPMGENFELRGFQHHCLTDGEIGQKASQTAQHKTVQKRKKKVKVRAVDDSAWTHSEPMIVPSVPWMNI
jgi:hypothetical protein